MERIILFQTDKTAEEKIRRLVSPKKIVLLVLQQEHAAGAVGDLAEGKDGGPLAEQLPEGSLMLFCGVSEKHLDKLLFEMRSKNIHVDYKAVLTPVNRRWTLPQLMRELQRERLQMLMKGK